MKKRKKGGVKREEEEEEDKPKAKFCGTKLSELGNQNASERWPKRCGTFASWPSEIRAEVKIRRFLLCKRT